MAQTKTKQMSKAEEYFRKWYPLFKKGDDFDYLELFRPYDIIELMQSYADEQNKMPSDEEIEKL